MVGLFADVKTLISKLVKFSWLNIKEVWQFNELLNTTENQLKIYLLLKYTLTY